MNFKRYYTDMLLKGSQLGVAEEATHALLKYAKRLYDNGLPIIYDQRHFSLLCGKDYDYLIGVSNHKEGAYKRYYLLKRSGGRRLIMEPLPSLKEVQEWILKNILYPTTDYSVAKVAKAFVPGIGLRENVRFHTRKKIVVNFDLKDFFFSVRFKEVRNIFSQLGYADTVAIFLASLCTCHNALPQGAPTSPMLSNMAFKTYDEAIFSYCRENKILYTRYADDMSMSGDFDIDELVKFICCLFKNSPFRINWSKFKVYNKSSRQLVTNIVVNDYPQVCRTYRRNIRKEIHYIKKFGIESHLKKIGITINPVAYLRVLAGRINYCLLINRRDTEMDSYKQFISDSYLQFTSKEGEN